jgi:hypothetical protein
VCVCVRTTSLSLSPQILFTHPHNVSMRTHHDAHEAEAQLVQQPARATVVDDWVVHDPVCVCQGARQRALPAASQAGVHVVGAGRAVAPTSARPTAAAASRATTPSRPGARSRSSGRWRCRRARLVEEAGACGRVCCARQGRADGSSHQARRARTLGRPLPHADAPRTRTHSLSHTHSSHPTAAA